MENELLKIEKIKILTWMLRLLLNLMGLLISISEMASEILSGDKVIIFEPESWTL